MPVGNRVHNCVERLVRKGSNKEEAIKFCQETTNQSYNTGKSLGKKKSPNKGN